ncbi:MAG: hypothetical protein WCY09_09085, partial [Candidatus Omnitrophota bacterium]
KEIKPRQEWVSSLKMQIMSGQAIKPVGQADIFVAERSARIWDMVSGVMSQRRFAYASATFVFLVVVFLGFARYTMPGDVLYPIKKVAEQQIQTPLKIAYNRSEELVQIVKENKTQNLEPAITEYKSSVSDAAKNLADALTNAGDKQTVAQVLTEVKKLQENQQQLEVLGLNIEDGDEMSELNSALETIVKNQITDLEAATLTEEQQAILTEAKDLYAEENYSDALEKILEIN